LKTSTVFKDNAGIFGKVYFPRLIMPLSIVVSNLVRFGVQFLLLIGLIIYYYFTPTPGSSITLSPSMLFFPFLVLLMALLGLGLGLIITAMTTKYRDLAFLVSFGVQLLMYATTVTYPLSEVKAKFKPMVGLIELNPMTYIIEAFRKCLLGNGECSLNSISYATSITLIILFFGILVFNKTEKNFVDTI
jgi:lipopolysaccharide transport system permease protein